MIKNAPSLCIEDQISPSSSLRNLGTMPSEKSSQHTGYLHIDEHLLTVEEVCRIYGTDFSVSLPPMKNKGLSEEQIKEFRSHTSGANVLSPPPRRSPIKLFISFLFGVFNCLLLVSGLMSLFLFFIIDTTDTENLYLGIVLFVVSFANAGMEFIQEFRTAALLETFRKMVPLNTMVIRDYSLVAISASGLIPGDLISLRAGDKVPADARVVYSSELKVDNSSLTGESEPQERNSTVISSVDVTPQDASNLVFNGTNVVCGEALAIVIRIGDSTLLGQIAGLTMSGERRPSQLGREIDVFVKSLAAVAIITAVIFFIFGLIKHVSIGMNFSFAVGVFISFVPEGLPLTVTALLTLSAKKMASRNVLVKDLHGVETLGSITLLATDKTGTLTLNKMAVSEVCSILLLTSQVWINSTLYSVDSQFCAAAALSSSDAGPIWPPQRILDPIETKNIRQLIEICALCTKCRMQPQGETVEFIGDATETGLLKFALNLEPALQQSVIDPHPMVWEIPFSSNTKWHLTVHRYEHKNGHFIAFLKGAPERVIARCKFLIGPSSLLIPWNDVAQSDFDSTYSLLASHGRRVLGLASLPLDVNRFPAHFKWESGNSILDEFRSTMISEDSKLKFEFQFLSLSALIDPPKPGVRKAINSLRIAGVQVVMVTGDHPLTAQAIARQVGILQNAVVDDIPAPTKSIRSNKSPAIISNSNPNNNKPYEEMPAGIVVHGDTIDGLTEQLWDFILSHSEIVFARTTPKHKLEIVTRCQAKGHIVGVSGDGVNDSPALKKADLGISMNVSASDVSKEAAAMILLDDNFCSIIAGIEQGRLLFANLKKSIRYTLTHSIPEIFAFLCFIALGLPLPINTLLLLTIDLATELAPSISLAWEPSESDLMLVPPRKVLCTDEMSCAQYEADTGDQQLANQNATLNRYSMGQFQVPYRQLALLESNGRKYSRTLPPPTHPYHLPLNNNFTTMLPITHSETALYSANHPVLDINFPTNLSSSVLPSQTSRIYHLVGQQGFSKESPHAQISPAIQSEIHIFKDKRTDNTTSQTSILPIHYCQSSEPETKVQRRYFDWIIKWYKRNFTRQGTGEVLVDSDLVIWAYLEGGLFVAAGAFLAYFCSLVVVSGIPIGALFGAADSYFQINAPLFLDRFTWQEQMNMLLSAQSSYYVGVVIGQFFTLFMVKKIYDYPIGRDLFKNRRSLLAIGITLIISSVIIYVPWVHFLIPAAPVEWWILFVPLITGTAFFIFEIVRRSLRRRGYFGGIPEHTDVHLEFVRTATTSIYHSSRQPMT